MMFEKEKEHRVPTPVIAIVSETLAAFFSRTQLVTIFNLASAPGPEPQGNKTDMCANARLTSP